MKHRLTIDGMSCGHCVRAVEAALASLDGVHVEDVQIGHAVVDTGPEILADGALSAAVEEEGFHVTAVETVH